MAQSNLTTKGKTVWRIRNTKIQTRMVLLFLLLALLPMAITSYFASQQSTQALQNKINTYSRQVVNQVARNIQVEMKRLEYDTIEIGFSERVQELLENYRTLTEWEKIDAQYAIRDTLVKKFSFLHDVSDVLLFTAENEKIIAYGDEGLKLNFTASFQNRLLSEIKRENGGVVWEAASWEDEEHIVERIITYRNGLIVGRSIKSLFEGEDIGAVLIRTNERFFAEIYQEIDLGTGAEIFIIDEHGMVVSSRTTAIPFKKAFVEETLIRRLLEHKKVGSTVFTMDINHNPYLVAYSPLERADWYVVSTIPYSYLNFEAAFIRRRIILLGLGCFFLAVFLSIFFTKSIVAPLHNLIKAMNKVKQGNLSFNLPDDSKDEIAVVTHHFNSMVKEIEGLMEDVKQKESQKRKAELKALQAQINPHFLSNVLNTARLLATAQNAQNLESLLASIIQLLHVSMGKDDELITVRKELDYLRNYLNIQEYRYYQKFQVNFALEEEILDCKLPKFLLQPILENSIIHGIGPKKGQGEIEVKGYLYEDKLIMTIIDDGIGMSKEAIATILEAKNGSANRFSGIGIKNVQERIKLFFGDKYGLRLESNLHHFTMVEITLPIIR